MERDLFGAADSCAFCALIDGRVPRYRVFEDGQTLAFLDHRPMVRGHCTLVPKTHYPTRLDIPPERVTTLFTNAQMLSRTVQTGRGTEGSFLAINTMVSQSVLHLHTHVMPRWRNDGLCSMRMIRQRRPYPDRDAARRIQATIRSALSLVVSGDRGLAQPPSGETPAVEK